MIARVWRGVVAAEKAEGYAQYLSDSDRGLSDYLRTPGNRGALLLRRDQGGQVHFTLVSFWDSRESIRAYAGEDIEKARYFPYDLECLIEPESLVTHHEVVSASADLVV